MSVISDYPVFSPLSQEMADELHAFFDGLHDGISEFTFSGLFLFRMHYNYEIARAGENVYVIRGEHNKKRFFLIPGAIPRKEVVDELFDVWGYWKNIGKSAAEGQKALFDEWKIDVRENRDNSDYLYMRSDLVSLSGKKFHKKKNLVNAFSAAHTVGVKPLGGSTKGDALKVLDLWNSTRRDISDYGPAKEALENIEKLRLQGIVVYADGKPAGWSLGETLAGGSMFAVHFEKGDEEFKGIYQFVNREMAARMPESVVYVNREQDLGDEGLRQAKMTYRPCGFVTKYDGIRV